jgi:hypothetical protein
VALIILPSTDLYLMGRQREHDVVRGVTPAHRMLPHGVGARRSDRRNRPWSAVQGPAAAWFSVFPPATKA